MPIYVYECRECKEEVEEIQKHDAPPPELCPACGRKGTLRRAMPLSNFQLKGPGWSKDGYGS
jgi:putative FmdB family regulatory protein